MVFPPMDYKLSMTGIFNLYLMPAVLIVTVVHLRLQVLC